MSDPALRLAPELGLPPRGVEAVLSFLAAGKTVPFIARYRKEATGGLDETAIRAIEERSAYLTELDARRSAIRKAISEQGELTPELDARLEACGTKTELEDLYLPYRKKRRTRATMARERGLEPLAERILSQPPTGDPTREAAAFVDPEREVPDAAVALAGARDIVAEAVAERADLRSFARRELAERGRFVSRAIRKQVAATGPTKYEDYYDYSEPAARVPSHRYLAVRRGEAEGFLRVGLEVDESRLLPRLLAGMGHRPGSPFAKELAAAVDDGYRRLLFPSVAKDVLAEMKERSDAAALEIFAKNLESLLLAPPLGEKPVLGVDPGFRTGLKCAALEPTGRFAAHETIYPFDPKRRADAARSLRQMVEAHAPAAIAVGNGTASREAMAFVREALGGAGPMVLSVSESGASVYSASEIAREEFPDLDLTVRGAISIGRRLQDPLAELVKVEPNALGVGQYQHDVHPPRLARKLGEVVESCVNRVGVELNTASAPLLSRVAGIGPTLAKAIVRRREARGPFESRRQLLEVKGLGPRAFEQAAGFLRIRGASHPLDASAVHPERYELVARMAADLGVELGRLVGSSGDADRIRIDRYVGGDVGEPTLLDIVTELKKPGRDPRDSFVAPVFREDVTAIDDVKPEMTFTGVVTNVTAFGAFVDIGVHQDGLVHVSELSDRFVRDPAEAVRTGQALEVVVLAVDAERGRISLSARSEDSRRRRPPRRR